MRLRIYSDLHLETNSFCPPTADCDAVVLAGDIHERREGVRWARAAFPDTPVIYVAGNHEHYGLALPEAVQQLQEAARGSNVRVLERDSCVVGGVRFLGCTLWSDFDLLHDPGGSMREAQLRGLDYREIKAAGARRFRPADAASVHRRASEWLWRVLEESHDGPTVVVTHHAPSATSVPDRYLTRLRAAAYASHLDPLVEFSGAQLWVHGHVHRRCDYWIGDTRVLCNPRGVGDESVDEFDPGLTVEVE